MWHGCMIHLHHMAQIQQNQKFHWMSHHFWDFNDKPILLHYNNVILLSFQTKLTIITLLDGQVLWTQLSEDTFLCQQQQTKDIPSNHNRPCYPQLNQPLKENYCKDTPITG